MPLPRFIFEVGLVVLAFRIISFSLPEAPPALLEPED